MYFEEETRECFSCGKIRKVRAMSAADPTTCVRCFRNQGKYTTQARVTFETKCLKCDTKYTSPHKRGICDSCKDSDEYKFGCTGYALYS